MPHILHLSIRANHYQRKQQNPLLRLRRLLNKPPLIDPKEKKKKVKENKKQMKSKSKQKSKQGDYQVIDAILGSPVSHFVYQILI